MAARTVLKRSVIRPGVAALAVLAVVGSMLASAGTANAANTDVVISELMYNPYSDVDGDEFLELTNTGVSTIDVSGWCFSGITLCFASGTTMAAGSRLVVSKDAARFQLTYGFAPNAVYTGGLSNGGEKITLKDATAATVDSVTYSDHDPWPTTPDGGGPSLELIDPLVDHNNPDNWAASVAPAGYTPGAPNSVAGTGVRPHISAVAATPSVPAASQPVTVTATITGADSAVLRSQTDFGAQTTTPMTTGDGTTFSATIPGAAAGHLIRYRVEATNVVGTSYSPRLDDTSPYRGVVASSGVTSAVPVLEWFMADADYNLITTYPTVDIVRPGVLAYNGTVFDNVMFSIRGESTQNSLKVSWKVDMPQDHSLQVAGLVEPEDEFALNADYSDLAHGRNLLSWNAYSQAGVVDEQIMPVRVQKNSVFYGLYNYTDIFDGTWRDREGYSDKQFYKAGHGAFDATKQLVEFRFEKKKPKDEDFTTLAAFLNGVDLTGTAQANNLLASGNIPEIINYAVASAIVLHADSSSKNFYLSQDQTTGRWSIIPWDLDHTWGHKCCGVTSNFVTPAEPQDQTSELMRAVLAVPDWRTMYFRRLRTVVNQVLAAGQLEGLYDAKVTPAAPEITLDLARWPKPGVNTTAAAQRTQLFSAIQSRRNAFAADSRVPGNQSASPAIEVNEIQPSAVNGTGGQFVELYNPSATEAVDLSGWTLSGSVAATIQPGTVILPHGTMTFVANDPSFRAAYGGLVFVGGTFTGSLPGTGTVTLSRTDASVANTVSYGGVGWPDTSTGQSMELVDPTSDNTLGSSWAASVRAAGSPGAANQVAAAGTLPGAPTIGTAAAGATAATVRWTAPASNGGTPIAGYRIRVLDGIGNPVGVDQPASPVVTSVVVTGLTAGTAYQFQVAAINTAGVGPFSGSSNLVTPVVPSASSVPIIGTAASGAAGGTITATARWTPPTSAGSSPVLGYQLIALQMSSTATNATVLGASYAPVTGASARSKSFTLAPGIYRFIVIALNNTGFSNPSARSNAVTAQ